jgi:hypothetical protein
MIDYFNGYARACSLGFVAQIKIMREYSLIFLEKRPQGPAYIGSLR